MKLLFDSQILDEQKYGGISRYFSEIFTELDRENISYRVPITYSNNEYINNVPRFKKQDLIKNYNKRIINKIDFKYKGFLRKYYDYLDPTSNFNLSKKFLKKGDFDIFHPTYYHYYFLKYINDKKFVLTIHDMIHELYPEYFKLDRGKTAKKKKRLALKADKIIAVSENTKKDIIKFYNLPPEKINVIHLASSIDLSGKIEAIEKLPNKYILFVGSRHGYKNFLFFVKAISKILIEDRKMFIVTTGGYSGKNNFSTQENKIFTDLGIKNQIIQYPVNDEQLKYLYKNARCFVFPTLYEGFGIPLLEAFSCECPAVVSNSSSLPEIGGNAAEYFNPLASDDIIRAVKKVAYNDDIRNKMISEGLERLKNYSWEKTVKKTIETYRSILK